MPINDINNHNYNINTKIELSELKKQTESVKTGFSKNISNFVNKLFNKGSYQPTVKISDGNTSVTVTKASLIKFLEKNALEKGTTVEPGLINKMVESSLTKKDAVKGRTEDITSISIDDLQKRLETTAKNTVEEHLKKTGGIYIDPSKHPETEI